MRSYEGRYTFWEGYRNACRLMEDAQELRFRRAIDSYAFDGEEPDFSDDNMLAMGWELIFAHLDKGVRQSMNGRMGKQRQMENNPDGYTKQGSAETPVRGAKLGLVPDPKLVLGAMPNWGSEKAKLPNINKNFNFNNKYKGEGESEGEGLACPQCGQPLYEKPDGSMICFSCFGEVAL